MCNQKKNSENHIVFAKLYAFAVIAYMYCFFNTDLTIYHPYRVHF